MAKSLYIVAILATIAILAVLFFSVSAAENQKAAQFNDEIRQFALESELQSSYADFDTNNRAVYCTIINQGIESLSKRSDVLEKQLNSFKDNSVNTQEFYTVKRNYLITNMILFRNFLNAKEYCSFNRKSVLFFYAEDRSCDPQCGVTGSQLFELRDCNAFRVFNFPYNWPQYEFTKILEVKYDVKTAGTIIIDSNKYESLLDMNTLTNLLGCGK
ncbi:MAG: hypothetical protein WCI04_01365 [archaeon]